MSRSLVVLLLALAFALLPLTACRKGEPVAGNVVRGMIAPDVTLQNTTGQNVSLKAYRGKIVFLNFWATWCPPCRSEMPSMERLNEVFANKDFVMLAVNVEKEGMTSVGPFLQQYPHQFTVLLDPDSVAQNLYGVNRFPETFIIDRQGKVIDRVIGARDWSSVEMLNYFSGLLAQP